MFPFICQRPHRLYQQLMESEYLLLHSFIFFETSFRFQCKLHFVENKSIKEKSRTEKKLLLLDVWIICSFLYAVDIQVFFNYTPMKIHKQQQLNYKKYFSKYVIILRILSNSYYQIHIKTLCVG